MFAALRSRGASGLLRAVRRRLRPVRAAGCYAIARAAVAGKAGLEIGGPSDVFARHSLLPLYPSAGSVDNCNFGRMTVWEGAIVEGLTFVYDRRRPTGRQYILEGTALTPIAAEAYDFVLSSHTLEHIANPLGALSEWRRVLKPGGALVLILPDRAGTFDHRRPVTTMAHLVGDFERHTQEDDTTHLAEILSLHDLTRDPPAGDFDAFKARSERNVENRCLHHHVFDAALVEAMMRWVAMPIAVLDWAPPYHIVAVATRPSREAP